MSPVKRCSGRGIVGARGTIAGDRTLHNNVDMWQAGTLARRHMSGREDQASRQDSSSLRLLFAVPFSPRADAMHGGRVVAQLLYRLADRHRVGVVYMRHSGSGPIDPGLAARCELVEEVERSDLGPDDSPSRRRLHVLSAPLTGLPSQVAPLHDRSFAGLCAEIAGDWQPDIVQVEHDHLAFCGPVLREGDRAPALVLMSHEPGGPASEELANATHGRRRLAHRVDTASWRRYWARTLPAFDAVVTLTDRDRDVMAAAAPNVRILSIGLGIDIPPQPLSATGRGEPSVLFVGGYWHPPNSDAALRLVRSIMPAVRTRMPGLRLVLVGARPGRELMDAATAEDTVTGTVPSVTPFLDQASLLVLPIRLGGGMRVKLLEALAAGKAVIASPLAASGLDITDGEHLVLARTDEDFAESIVTLVSDQAARSQLGRGAREWAMRNLGWDARVEEYEALYRSLLPSRAS